MLMSLLHYLHSLPYGHAGMTWYTSQSAGAHEKLGLHSMLHEPHSTTNVDSDTNAEPHDMSHALHR